MFSILIYTSDSDKQALRNGVNSESKTRQKGVKMEMTQIERNGRNAQLSHSIFVHTAPTDTKHKIPNNTTGAEPNTSTVRKTARKWDLCLALGTLLSSDNFAHHQQLNSPLRSTLCNDMHKKLDDAKGRRKEKKNVSFLHFLPFLLHALQTAWMHWGDDGVPCVYEGRAVFRRNYCFGNVQKNF